MLESQDILVPHRSIAVGAPDAPRRAGFFPDGAAVKSPGRRNGQGSATAMATGDQGSVTRWLGALKAGDPDAAQRLWERYFADLVRLARARLRRAPRAAEDEEDVALSAFDSFCTAATQRRFPRLDDRDDLWRVLVTLTERKAADLRRRRRRQKRGGGRVAPEADLETGPNRVLTPGAGLGYAGWGHDQSGNPSHLQAPHLDPPDQPHDLAADPGPQREFPRPTP
jgi:DNA-directed RNA polymerase specialized sigma24 family protein